MGIVALLVFIGVACFRAVDGPFVESVWTRTNFCRGLVGLNPDLSRPAGRDSDSLSFHDVQRHSYIIWRGACRFQDLSENPFG